MPGGRAKLIVVVVAVICSTLPAIGLLIIRAKFRRQHIYSEILKHFSGTVDARKFRVHYFPHPGCTIEGLVMRTRSDAPDAPFGSADKVNIDGSYLSLITGSRRLRISVEHGRIRLSSVHDLAGDFRSGEGQKILVEQAEANDLLIEIGPERDQALRFEVRHIAVGPIVDGRKSEATLEMINPLPRGELRVHGEIGPWNNSWKDAPVSGAFQLNRADLSVFSGISGTVSSSGTAHGTLSRIGVDGQAQVNDFEVKVSSHPVHLDSKFHAEVDGTNGDVELSSLETLWGQTRLESTGRVAGGPGTQGKVADLRFSVTHGRIEDLMELAMRSAPTLRGPVAFEGNAVWPPGDEPFIRRIQFDANFQIDRARFTRRHVQANFNKLSERALGEKDRVMDEVVASLRGHVELRHGSAHFSNAVLTVPGATATVAGSVNLVSRRLDIAENCGPKPVFRRRRRG
jgi:hypothetical protein